MTPALLEFSKQHPNDRLASIRNGYSVRSQSARALSACLLTIFPQVLEYGRSSYIQEFGMVVENEPLGIQGRVLDAPTLKYNPVSKQPTAVRDFSFSFSH
jgi:hypothetical protein